MLAPTNPSDVAADKTLVPRAWKGGERYDFMAALAAWWSGAEDVNNSDLDCADCMLGVPHLPSLLVLHILSIISALLYRVS